MSLTPTRRHLLVSAALGGVALGGGLTACSSDGSGGGSAASNGEVADWPTYTERTDVPEPDIPGTADGVAPAYFTYPENATTSVEGEIGDGSEVKALALTYGQPPVPMDSNDYWQMINEKTNLTYTPQIVPANDFSTKFPTIMAGGDLPDLMQVPVFMGLPKLPQLSQSQWTDLSDHLSGDAVNDYPNIANLPAYAWKTCRIGGRLIGTPLPRPPFGNVLFQRLDLIEEMGLDPEPTTKDDFVALCEDLTDAKAGRYALTGYSVATGVDWLDNIIGPMFGVPNNWELDGGALTASHETDQFFEALDFKKMLWDAGLFHPDSPSIQSAETAAKFISGDVVMRTDGLAWWAANQADHQDLSFGAMTPFSANGGEPINYQGAGAFSFTAIKKGLDEERVKMLLRFINYCAAPFGSTEYFDQNFGVKDTDYTVDSKGQPELTSQGTNELGINLKYLGAPPAVLFWPKRVDDALKAQSELQKKLVPMLMEDPTLGFYSETDERSTTINQPITDASTGYILGRNSLDDVKSAIERWKSAGGDKIREEFEQAIADGS
ncbi:hypothetical protein CFK39_06720 [Brachybacterium avium]|uniref:Sugar ABC transporter substrate-binding protein n=1 Tax=Brachybacterium avium TaxID=2017485 RepID=A0A220UBJ1_9MICO|nr:extracellular solute-binding protein [Brachybacterium avium]ASK65578.1 hypothetical protein CFK39_06720 [Brachybacterium avium]